MTNTVKNAYEENNADRISSLEKNDKSGFFRELLSFCSEGRRKQDKDFERFLAYKSVSRIYLELSEEFFNAENEVF